MFTVSHMLFQDPVYPVSYDKSDKFNEYLRMQGLIGMDPQALVPEVGFVPGTAFQKHPCPYTG